MYSRVYLSCIDTPITLVLSLSLVLVSTSTKVCILSIYLVALFTLLLCIEDIRIVHGARAYHMLLVLSISPPLLFTFYMYAYIASVYSGIAQLHWIISVNMMTLCHTPHFHHYYVQSVFEYCILRIAAVGLIISQCVISHSKLLSDAVTSPCLLETKKYFRISYLLCIYTHFQDELNDEGLYYNYTHAVKSHHNCMHI